MTTPVEPHCLHVLTLDLMTHLTRDSSWTTCTTILLMGKKVKKFLSIGSPFNVILNRL